MKTLHPFHRGGRLIDAADLLLLVLFVVSLLEIGNCVGAAGGLLRPSLPAISSAGGPAFGTNAPEVQAHPGVATPKSNGFSSPAVRG